MQGMTDQDEMMVVMMQMERLIQRLPRELVMAIEDYIYGDKDYRAAVRHKERLNHEFNTFKICVETRWNMYPVEEVEEDLVIWNAYGCYDRTPDDVFIYFFRYVRPVMYSYRRHRRRRRS